MNNTTILLTLTAVIMLTACSRTPKVTEESITSTKQPTVEQHIIDAKKYPLTEQKISSVKSFPAKESEVLKQKAYLAEESLGTAAFLENGLHLFQLTQQLQPHQVSVKSQILACLGAIANQKPCIASGIATQISEIIVNQCDKPTLEDLRAGLTADNPYQGDAQYKWKTLCYQWVTNGNYKKAFLDWVIANRLADINIYCTQGAIKNTSKAVKQCLLEKLDTIINPSTNEEGA